MAFRELDRESIRGAVKVAGKYTLDKELAGRQDFRAAHPAHPAAQKALEQGPVNVAGPLEQTESRKRAACYAHASQNPVNGFYGTYHEKMNRFRGLECACELAEGFVRHCQSPTAAVPGL